MREDQASPGPVAGWALVSLGLSLAVFAWLAWSFRGYTPDDTFIFLRYAQNFGDGRGLVFNPGERVYGNTSVLWSLALGAAAWAGLPLLAVAKLAGATFGAATIIIVQRLAARIDAGAAIAAPIIMVGFLDLSYWAVSGMDTTLFACLVALALLATVRAAEGGSDVLAGLAWGVAAVARPEGVGLGIVALAWLAWQERAARRRVWPSLAAFVLPVALLVAGTWAYYGDPVPNTYWAKRFDRAEAFYRGLIYLRAFVLNNDGALIAGATAMALLFVRGHVVRLTACVITAYTAYLLWVGGDSWSAPGAARFATPMLAPLAVMMAAGLSFAGALLASRSSRAAAITTAAVLAVWLAFPSTDALITRRIGSDATIVSHLARHAAADDAVAVTDIGWVGYETGLRVIDTFGLVDPWVARELRKRNNSQYRTGDAERLADYVLGRAPRWIILKGTVRPDGSFDVHDETGARVIARDPRFVAGYRFAVAAAEEPYLLYERVGPAPGGR